jgi:hypothetical protein
VDWARDHLGNDVPAWRGGISGFGLTCPSCGEPVRRRAGGERRPHFAHYSHRAKPDCENYFPSQGNILATGAVTDVRVLSGQWKRESLSCGIFLAVEPGRTSLALWLRIPPMFLERNGAGRLEIQSGLGHRTYHFGDLSSARLVPMSPQVPLAVIAGFGDLLPLAAQLSGQIAAFAADRNLFYANEKGGRFIFSDELLEWGVGYRLLTVHEITPPQELGRVLNWKPEGKFGGWYSYELALPSVFAGSKPDLHSELAYFLGHRIRSSRPRLYVIDPLPHHFEVGGTYVFSGPTRSLLLRKSGKGETSVKASVGTVEASISEHGDEWVRVEGLSADGRECTIAIDGNEQMILRVETCELFQPSGIAVGVDDLSWDLCVDAPLAENELVTRTVKIDCGNVRIAAYLARLNEGWVLDETQLSLPSGSPKNFLAGSFGELRGNHAASQQEQEESLSEKPAAPLPTLGVAVRWIEQLVIRNYGTKGVSQVRRFLSNPSQENLYRLGPIMTSRLMPYIRAAQHQQQNQTRGD